jgi:folate-binding Fe-S cluster repair protein YgfZ
VVKNSSKSASVDVKINMPFDDWLVQNQGKLPWYSPPTKESKNKVVTKLQIEAVLNSVSTEELLAEALQEAGGNANKLAEWTRDEIKEAYSEARERLEKKTVPVKVKVDFNKEGVLTISFSDPVSFPSYLMR